MKKFLMTAMAVSLFALSAEAQYYGNQGHNRSRSTYQTQSYSANNQRRVNQKSVARSKGTTNRSVYSSHRRGKNTSEYRIGNPLYHPRSGQTLLAMGGTYEYFPREEAISQDKATGWVLTPDLEIGLTNSLSAYVKGGYGEYEIKSGESKGEKTSLYNAEIGLRYLLASVDGFDFNINAGLSYEKMRDKKYKEEFRATGTNVGLQVGKKIQNVTPYFGVTFATDFWSKRWSSTGTRTYINPGVYIDLTNNLSLDLSYTSETDEAATYSASFDLYAADNVMLRLGGFITHPETDQDSYGALASFKVGF